MSKENRSQPNYLIYPSLLDAFQRYLNIDSEFDSFWNVDGEGEYKRSYEEIEESLRTDLLNSINRVPFESEAADKGTVFNEIVDCILSGKPSKDMVLKSNKEERTITAKYKQWTFIFDLGLCLQAAEYFKGATSQVFVKGQIDTSYGLVELYGYLDEVKRTTIYDIKTTSQYSFGKYEGGWQRHVYPYCLIESGEMTDITHFEFSAYQLSKPSARTPTISGKFYPESYKYNHEKSTELIRNQCERFIEFLERNKEYITNKKVFNQHLEKRVA